MNKGTIQQKGKKERNEAGGIRNDDEDRWVGAPAAQGGSVAGSPGVLPAARGAWTGGAAGEVGWEVSLGAWVHVASVTWCDAGGFGQLDMAPLSGVW